VPGFLVDSNVLLDVLTEDRSWLSWSSKALARCAEEGPLVINPLIYAEVSIGFDRIEELDDALDPAVFQRRPLPWETAFLAGKCFLRYRRRGGIRSSTLPDFYIGAHALVEGLTLVTRDAARYRTNFPRLPLVAPA
jgi:predicted nucleic acid-binding protein